MKDRDMTSITYLVAHAIAAVAIAVALWQVAENKLNEVYQRGHQAGYEAGVAAAPKANIDHQCVAWMFNTNLKQARKRVCTKGI